MAKMGGDVTGGSFNGVESLHFAAFGDPIPPPPRRILSWQDLGCFFGPQKGSLPRVPGDVCRCEDMVEKLESMESTMLPLKMWRDAQLSGTPRGAKEMDGR